MTRLCVSDRQLADTVASIDIVALDPSRPLLAQRLDPRPVFSKRLRKLRRDGGRSIVGLSGCVSPERMPSGNSATAIIRRFADGMGLQPHRSGGRSNRREQAADWLPVSGLVALPFSLVQGGKSKANALACAVSLPGLIRFTGTDGLTQGSEASGTS
jgi:hypothetical protein